MHAAVVEQFREPLVLREWDIPAPGLGQILVKTEACVARARPLEGEFYRSVDLSYAHPDDVISGEGSRLRGGRFAAPGIRAVYGSFDEPTAVGEAANRAARLAGNAGISFAGYPRVTYVIAVVRFNKFTLDAPEKNIRRNPSGRRANLRPTQRNRPRRS